jgi:hypothetical protein
MHDVDDVQDTPYSSSEADIPGLGVGWIVHWLPFHASAKVIDFPAVFSDQPTALHEVDDTHVTPKR